jgi:hypothetical protein
MLLDLLLTLVVFLFFIYQGIFHRDALARTPITPGTNLQFDRLVGRLITTAHKNAPAHCGGR